MDTFAPGPGKPKRPKRPRKGLDKPKTPGQLYLEQQEKENEEKKKREILEKYRPKPSLPPLKKGGSIKKGSSLRRQASTKGLRTSKKH
jgi:hypothetical protein